VAGVQALVLTASIDNEAAIREWMQAVRERVDVVDAALGQLSKELLAAPHISITLTQSAPAEGD
jgi:hypothetical protein